LNKTIGKIRTKIFFFLIFPVDHWEKSDQAYSFKVIIMGRALWLKIVGFFPSIILVLLIGWSYYCYVVSFCGLYLTIDYLPAAVIFLLFYHIIFFLLVISFYRIVFTEAGTPPNHFKVSPEIVSEWEQSGVEIDEKVSQHFGQDFKLLLKKEDGKLRYCNYCQLIKPDRAHHDSATGECVLKFDHFCPWVNNAVGFRNYKFFCLFIAYGCIYCLYIFVTSIPFVAMSFVAHQINFQWLFLLLITMAFSLALLGFVAMHLKFLLVNTTTIEDMQEKNFHLH